MKGPRYGTLPHLAGEGRVRAGLHPHAVRTPGARTCALALPTATIVLCLLTGPHTPGEPVTAYLLVVLVLRLRPPGRGDFLGCRFEPVPCVGLGLDGFHLFAFHWFGLFRHDTRTGRPARRPSTTDRSDYHPLERHSLSGFLAVPRADDEPNRRGTCDLLCCQDRARTTRYHASAGKARTWRRTATSHRSPKDPRRPRNRGKPPQRYLTCDARHRR